MIDELLDGLKLKAESSFKDAVKEDYCELAHG